MADCTQVARLSSNSSHAICRLSRNSKIFFCVFSSLHGHHKAMVRKSILDGKVDSSSINISNDNRLCSFCLGHSSSKQPHSTSSKHQSEARAKHPTPYSCPRATYDTTWQDD
ncbi:hypothetical protein KCU78_g51, partial [Aureobasidium melanogenum]